MAESGAESGNAYSAQGNWSVSLQILSGAMKHKKYIAYWSVRILRGIWLMSPSEYIAGPADLLAFTTKLDR